MSCEIKIRRAKEEDYEAINELYHINYDNYFKELPFSYKNPPRKVLKKGDFYNILESKECILFVAVLKKKIIGFVFAEIDDFEENDVLKSYHLLEILEIAVLPEFQSQGIGTKLIEEAQSWGKKRKVHEFSVLTYDFNKRAIRFYEKNGFKPYSIKLLKNFKNPEDPEK